MYAAKYAALSKILSNAMTASTNSDEVLGATSV